MSVLTQNLFAGAMILLLSAQAGAQDAGAEPACPTVPIGRACQSDAECGPGGLCFEGVSEGYCTVQRNLGCCPAGARLLPGLDLCVAHCAVDSDCAPRPARQCTSEGFCWGCLAPPVDAPIGRPCAADADCGGAGCLLMVGEVPVENGVCTLDLPANCCPAGSAPGLLGGAPFCLPVCRTDAQCGRPGWGCDYEANGVCRPGAQAPATDAGATDQGTTDTGLADQGTTDARTTDARTTDTGAADTGAADARFADSGVRADGGPAADAAPPCADASHTHDVGPSGGPNDDGCGCSVTGNVDQGTTAWLLFGLLLRLRVNRRRRS